jgi:hypothetical protein
MDVTVPAEDTVEDALANCIMSWDNKVTSFFCYIYVKFQYLKAGFVRLLNGVDYFR